MLFKSYQLLSSYQFLLQINMNLVQIYCHAFQFTIIRPYLLDVCTNLKANLENQTKKWLIIKSIVADK